MEKRICHWYRENRRPAPESVRPRARAVYGHERRPGKERAGAYPGPAGQVHRGALRPRRTPHAVAPLSELRHSQGGARCAGQTGTGISSRVHQRQGHHGGSGSAIHQGLVGKTHQGVRFRLCPVPENAEGGIKKVDAWWDSGGTDDRFVSSVAFSLRPGRQCELPETRQTTKTDGLSYSPHRAWYRSEIGRAHV